MGEAPQRRRRARRRRHAKVEMTLVDSASLAAVSVVEQGTQTLETSDEIEVRRSERLKTLVESKGFPVDKISELEHSERVLRKEILRDAWKDYDFRRITLVQYLKVASLVCEGFLREGPDADYRRVTRHWGLWEPFVR